MQWWAKRRRINSPYRGTLSSYGYVLMILHYLINVVQPPVLYNLQNLQLFPVPRDAPQVELIHEAPGAEGSQKYEVWFYKAIDQLAPTANKDSLGELLRGWLEYYSFKFQWGQSVVSIRTAGGILTKQEKGWVAAVVRPGGNQEGETWEVKDRYVFIYSTSTNSIVTCTSDISLPLKTPSRPSTTSRAPALAQACGAYEAAHYPSLAHVSYHTNMCL